jgi:hypothetical protein
MRNAGVSEETADAISTRTPFLLRAAQRRRRRSDSRTVRLAQCDQRQGIFRFSYLGLLSFFVNFFSGGEIVS